jgi:hypothetical protein
MNEYRRNINYEMKWEEGKNGKRNDEAQIFSQEHVKSFMNDKLRAYNFDICIYVLLFYE